MELSNWLLYLSLTLVAVISPGPAVLLSVANSLTHGFKESVFSSLGNIAGIFVVSSAAALGLGAVLQTSILLFTVLKIFGAIYLIHLGIQQWRAKHKIFEKSIKASRSRQGARKSFLQGFFVAISNPKPILFFTALFPQFIDLTMPIFAQFMILTTTFMFFSFTILVGYALSAHSAKDWFAKSNRAIWLNRVSGTIFITFGLGLLRLKSRNA